VTIYTIFVLKIHVQYFKKCKHNKRTEINHDKKMIVVVAILKVTNVFYNLSFWVYICLNIFYHC